MQIYLVGGAVRDELLNQPIADRDWVVVGTTPSTMQELGYQPVGKDFPVFLHPDTKEEYALARTERKTTTGHQGFAFNTSTEVTLVQDLERRDLTINAIARSDSGEIIDPYNGRRDLANKVLRHVSPAFAEDPLRVLRVARFCAKLAPLGFSVASDTLTLMRSLSDSGELDTLAPERVFAELSQALKYPDPVPFFETLRSCGALQQVLPELAQLYGVPLAATLHPQIDYGAQTMMVLTQTCLLTSDTAARYASICLELGKTTTPGKEMPGDNSLEDHGAVIADALSKRLRTPNDFRQLAVITARYHSQCHSAFELTAEGLLSLLMALDALRRPQRFELFLTVCEGEARGRFVFEQNTYPQADYLRGALTQLQKLNSGEIADQASASGDDIATRIRAARLQIISAYQKKYNQST